MELPFDPAAEMAVVGIALVGTQAHGYLFGQLSGADFFTPSLGAAFEAIRELVSQGRKADATTVRDILRTSGHPSTSAADLLGAVRSAPPSSYAPEYAEIIARLSASRRAMLLATGAAEALSGGQHPQTVVEGLIGDLSQIDSPVLVREPDDLTFQELLRLPESKRAPWVVPGLLRQDWRCLVVGREGDGKSILLRQLATTAAYGVHPFLGEPTPPQSVLIVDLENPQDEIRRWIEKLTTACRGTGEAGRVWHRPGGIDLRNRSSRADLEGVIRLRRPDLVVLGPLYKAYSTTSADNDERVASEVQHVLDDLRTRYSFSLLVETHAPHGFSGERDLRPFGSSLWLRWPELGLKLVPFDWEQRPCRIMKIERFRGDRVESAWPEGLHWGTGGQLPWQPDWGTAESPYTGRSASSRG